MIQQAYLIVRSKSWPWLLNVFRAESHGIIEIGLEETGKDWLANWEHNFYSHISALQVELEGYQVSMISADGLYLM